MVRLVPWSSTDRPLLEQLLGDPVMMEHLGGPESPEKIADRQARYEAPNSGMFKIIDCDTGAAVGSVGYWEKTWRGEKVLETGWSVLPAFQGRGIAVAATREAIAIARAQGPHRFLHAFPSVDNGASNAKGSMMRCNDWQLDLL